jgi:hypothetical protein
MFPSQKVPLEKEKEIILSRVEQNFKSASKWIGVVGRGQTLRV